MIIIKIAWRSTPRMALLSYSKKLESLYYVYGERLRAYVTRKLYRNFNSREDADDVVSESFLRYSIKLKSEEPKEPGAYLFSIANKVIWGKREKRQDHVSFTESEHENGFVTAGPEDTLQPCQEVKALIGALNQLSHKQRDIFILRRVHGLSHEEIADRYQMSKVAVERQITRAFRHCREEMRKNTGQNR